MTGDPNLLAALAAGGKRAGDEYLANQAAAQAQARQAMQATLSSSVAQQATPAAQGQLAAIQQQPVDQGGDYGARLAYNNLSYIGRLGDAATQYGNTFDANLADRMAAQAGAGGGGGGGGGGGRGGGGGGGRRGRSGGGSAKAPKPVDWVKQLRTDMGIVGSGLATKRAAPAYLAKTSLSAMPGSKLPRDLRSQQYLQTQYGAPAADVGKAQPITGFLSAGTKQLRSAMQHGVSYQQYAKDTQAAAKSAKGNQSKAVAYLLAQAQQALAAKAAKGKGGKGKKK